MTKFTTARGSDVKLSIDGKGLLIAHIEAANAAFAVEFDGAALTHRNNVIPVPADAIESVKAVADQSAAARARFLAASEADHAAELAYHQHAARVLRGMNA